MKLSDRERFQHSAEVWDEIEPGPPGETELQRVWREVQGPPLEIEFPVVRVDNRVPLGWVYIVQGEKSPRP